jgi:hypothetical protein
MTTRHSIGVGVVVEVDGQKWDVRVVLTTPRGTDRELEPIRSEIVKRLPSWIKAKIEKG